MGTSRERASPDMPDFRALLVLALLAVPLLPMATAQPADNPLTLQALHSAEPGSPYPGGTVMLPFLVTNPRDDAITANLVLNTSGQLRGYIEPGPSFQDIPGRSSRAFNATAAIPADAAPGAYDLRIEVTTPFRGEGTSVLWWVVHVRPTPAWSIRIEADEGTGVPHRGSTNLTVILQNGESAAASFHLAARALSGAPFAFSFDDASATAPPGAEVRRKLHVVLPQDNSSDWRHTIRVEATRMDAGDQGMQWADVDLHEYQRVQPPPPTPAPMMPPTWSRPTPAPAPAPLTPEASRFDVTLGESSLTTQHGQLEHLTVVVDAGGGYGYAGYRMREADGRISFRSAAGEFWVAGSTRESLGVEPSSAPPGDYVLVLDVWWTSNATLRQSATVPLRILPPPSVAPPVAPTTAPAPVMPTPAVMAPAPITVRVEAPPVLVAPGGAARGILAISAGSGAGPVSVHFIGIDHAPFDIAYDPPRFTVPAGETTRVSFTIRAPADVRSGLHTVREELRASHPLGDAERVFTIPVRVGSAAATPPGTAFGAMADVARDHPMATGGAIAALGAAVVLAPLSRREWWRYLAVAPFLPLYTRLAKRDVLDHKMRERIHQLVKDRPGIHYTALKEATQLNAGALVHHLRTLERHGLVTSRREGILRRFFPVGARLPPPPEVPLTPTQARILDLLAQRAMTQRELADALGITQQGASYHVKTLERKGQLGARRDGAELRYFRTPPGPAAPPDAEATA